MASSNISANQVVRDFILQEFLVGADPDELTDTTPLIESGILDSLAIIKLVTFLEERYEIVVEVDAERLATVQSIVDMVESGS
jgi:acyl carrier protein